MACVTRPALDEWMELGEDSKRRLHLFKKKIKFKKIGMANGD